MSGIIPGLGGGGGPPGLRGLHGDGPKPSGAGSTDAKKQQAQAAQPSQQKAVARRTVDYYAPYLKLFQSRLLGFTPSRWDLTAASMPLPMYSESYQLMPPIGYLNQPASNMPTKLATGNFNKVKSNINCVMWVPDGRRCMTGSNNGEFTVWDSRNFAWESALQAHESSVRSIQYTHSQHLIISCDDNGRIKLWNGRKDNFLDPLHVISAHREPVRSLTIAPTDRKFASASDDATIKVYDVASGAVEATLLGHGGDVRWVEWHPQQGLLASGSKDALVKLWDPRVSSGAAVATLHGHKNGLIQVRWNPHNGNWLLTSSRDQTLKVFDVRRLREINTYQGHTRDVTSCCWHPFQEELFASGGYEGSIMYWLVSRAEAQAVMPHAHDREVWSICWHPVGHVMVSGGGDQVTKFWCRSRPGDLFRERWDDDDTAHEAAMAAAAAADHKPAADSGVPGLGGVGIKLGGAALANLGIAAKIPGLGQILSKISQPEAAGVGSKSSGGGGGDRDSAADRDRDRDIDRDRERDRGRPDWDRDRDRDRPGPAGSRGFRGEGKRGREYEDGFDRPGGGRPRLIKDEPPGHRREADWAPAGEPPGYLGHRAGGWGQRGPGAPMHPPPDYGPPGPSYGGEGWGYGGGMPPPGDRARSAPRPMHPAAAGPGREGGPVPAHDYYAQPPDGGPSAGGGRGRGREAPRPKVMGPRVGPAPPGGRWPGSRGRGRGRG